MVARLKLVEEEKAIPAGVVDAALEIAARRADTLRQLRDALVRGDNEQALSIARKVCGLNDKKSHRATSS